MSVPILLTLSLLVLQSSPAEPELLMCLPVPILPQGNAAKPVATPDLSIIDRLTKLQLKRPRPVAKKIRLSDCVAEVRK